MRVLLKSRSTGLYYAGSGDWVTTAEDARDFGHSLAAVDYAKRKNLMESDLVFDFGPDAQNFLIPVIVGIPPHQADYRLARP